MITQTMLNTMDDAGYFLLAVVPIYSGEPNGKLAQLSESESSQYKWSGPDPVIRTRDLHPCRARVARYYRTMNMISDKHRQSPADRPRLAALKRYLLRPKNRTELDTSVTSCASRCLSRALKPVHESPLVRVDVTRQRRWAGKNSSPSSCMKLFCFLF